MKHTHQRLTALCLVICLLLPLFVGSVRAESVTETTLTLDASTVPECISYADAVQAGHIQRMVTSEQDLNTVVFRNANASDTIYMFGENVKYIGSDGAVHDKSNALTRKFDGSYRNSANDILVTYPAKIASGIALQTTGLSMQMIPTYTNNASVTATQDEDSDITKTVSYIGAFGAATVLQYTQTYSGFKEDIILGKRMDLNTFSFTVTTNGAQIVMESGVACVYYGGNLVGKFGEVYAYDTAGHTVFGTTAVTEVTPNQTYTLTISVPVSFLNDESTAFPVVIDPSFNVVGGASTELVQDTTIYTGYSGNAGSEKTIMVGDFSALSGTSTNGRARALVKFPNLTDHSTVQYYLDLNRTFSSVKYVFCGSGTVASDTTIRAYMMTSYWNESSVFSPTLWNAYTSSYGTSTEVIEANSDITARPRYELDITPFYERWTAGLSSNNGIMLMAQNEGQAAVAIYSWESGTVYGISGTKPYLQFEVAPIATTETAGIYNDGIYQLINTDSGSAIHYPGSLSMASPNRTLEAQRFRITYTGDGLYQIVPLYNEALCLAGWGNGPVTMSGNTSTVGRRWYIIPTTGGYRIYNNDGVTVLSYQMYEEVEDSGEYTETLVTQGTLENDVWELNCLSHLDVVLNKQDEGDTCGPACAVMVLDYYGITVTETDFISTVGTANFTNLYYICGGLTSYLTQAGKNITYTSTYIKNLSADGYAQLFRENIYNEHPVILLIKVTDKDHFPYLSPVDGGHFVVISGIYHDTASNTTKAIVVDPHHTYPGVYHVPIAALRTYSQNAKNTFAGCAETEVS